MSTDGLDELGLDEDDLTFLRENLGMEMLVHETVLNLRTPGLNLARQGEHCRMCGREVPFERIRSELVRASNTKLIICTTCGRCEGREGLHTFPVEVIDKQLGRGKDNPYSTGNEGLSMFQCFRGTLHKGQNHVWIMDRNQQRHGWCATCNNARIEIKEGTKGGLDLDGALKALAEKKKAIRIDHQRETMSVAEPYIKAGLAEPFALAIAAGTPAEEVMNLWESDWWRQYPADDSLIVSVLHGGLTEAEARIINEFRGEHRELAEACIEQLVPVAWAQMLMDSGFEDHPEAVRHVLEGADPALIARIQNISVNEPPSPLGQKIEPKGVVTAPQPPSLEPTRPTKKPDAPKPTTKKRVDIKFREDMLLRVMNEFGIVDREAFLEHAAAFDVEMNGYLKKGEFQKAGEAWNQLAKTVPKILNNMPWFNATKQFGGVEACPKCGTAIVRGTTACGSCGHKL